MFGGYGRLFGLPEPDGEQGKILCVASDGVKIEAEPLPPYWERRGRKKFGGGAEPETQMQEVYRVFPRGCGKFFESPFEDGEFSVLLCAHFLFYYDDRLDYEYHKRAVDEMLRVCSKEVRIFPLFSRNGEKSRFVKPVIYEYFSRGYGISVEKTGSELDKTGGDMLIIRKD